MDAYRHIVVTVHDADAVEPGETLRALAATLPGPPGSYHRSDLVLGAESYPRLVNSAPSLPDLVEVNWSDLRCPRRAWIGALQHLLRLVMELPAVCFEWCGAAPSVRVRPAYQDAVTCTFLWTVWPVLLSLIHAVVAPVAPTHALLLDGAALGALAVLARTQWQRNRRVTAAGYFWLWLSAGLTVLLWIWPQWTALATRLSIRVYGFGQLVSVALLLALGIEIGVRRYRGLVGRQPGLSGFAIALLPLALLFSLSCCLWALVFNAVLAGGSPPVLDAFKAWQQTFATTLGYHLVSAAWAAGGAVALVGVLALAGSAHLAWTQDGGTARRWLAALLALLPVVAGVAGLSLLLTSPYLGAPLGKLVQRLGPGTTATSVYTWSALCLIPWLLLAATPAWRVLRVLGDVGLYLVPAYPPETCARRICQERFAQLLQFVDRGRYDRIHVIAHGQGALVALDALQGTSLNHPLVLTTLGCPAATLYRELLDWPFDPAALAVAEWCNLFRQDDAIGGPTGLEGVDAPLPLGGDPNPWLDAFLADRVVQVMRSPLNLAP